MLFKMKIGKVISINYSQIRVKISSGIRGGTVNYNGNTYYFGNIGSYLKISNSLDEVIICEVVSIFDADTHKEKVSFDIESNRELLVKPIGTIDNDKNFNLGIGIFPALYSDVSIVTIEDLKIILKTNNNESKEFNNIHQNFRLGTSKNMINYPIDISIDKFFNIHSSVLGNSGSGKSNTIAHILQEIYKMENNSATGSKVIIFDVNGEYKNAFLESKNTNIICRFLKPNIDKKIDDYNPFHLPHFLLTIDEWSSFLLATEATQRPFWDKVLQESYRFYQIGSNDEEEAEKFVDYLRYRVCNIVYSALRQADTDTSRITTAVGILGSIVNIIKMHEDLRDNSDELLNDIDKLQRACNIEFGKNDNKLKDTVDTINKKINDENIQNILNRKFQSGKYFDFKFLQIAAELILLEEDARGNKQIRSYTATMLTRLEYFLNNSECKFMRDNPYHIKNVDDFLLRIGLSDDNHSQLVIIDTSELSPDILETLTSVFARILFDERRKLNGDDRRKKPIHLILDEAHRYIKKNYNYLIKENIFEKIAREGRKYSFYLLLSSQRPSELSETALSQCANFIIHRIQNEKDMKYVQAILPYFSEDFTNKIKQSTPGEALVFGSCVSMPLHLKVIESNPSPDSKNCDIPKEWFISNEKA